MLESMEDRTLLSVPGAIDPTFGTPGLGGVVRTNFGSVGPSYVQIQNFHVLSDGSGGLPESWWNLCTRER